MNGKGGTRRRILALLAAAALAGCSYVKPMSPTLKKAVAARDTIYVLPGKTHFSTVGLLFERPDSARMREVQAHADRILPEEVRRAFPAATVIPVSPGGEDSIQALAGGATVISWEIEGFKRTTPRQVVSEIVNVLFMVPTFSLNLAYPIHTTSNVYLKVRKPGAAKVVKLKHRDVTDASALEDLRFQIRILLDPDAQA